MKKLLLFIVLFVCSAYVQAQTTVFSDDFESGTTNWTITGSWGLSTASSHSTSHSLTESPTGNYGDNLNMITATMTNGVNLNSALSADLSFWAKYNIEGGFDYMYLDVSADGGTSWINLSIYDDTLSNWTQFNYSLGGYVGNTNVKIRFRFYSDGAVNFDGMYIDDVVITSYTVDNSPPLVVHTAPVFYNATNFQDSISADIIDVSGVGTANIHYRVDGGSFSSVSGVSMGANSYTFIIPQQVGGALVDYYFEAIDNASTPNTAITDTFSFISGNYISYDNGQVDFVDSTGIDKSVAVKITMPSSSVLNGILIRNYTDANRPNDSMLVHVWTNAGGYPGVDMITPFKVMPKATLQNTSAMTNIDLRPYAAQLSNLSGTIFIGFNVPAGGVWSAITQPGITSRSFVKSGTGSWAAASGTSGSIDYQFRAITSPYAPPTTVNFSFDTSLAPIVSFTDLTTPTATAWTWKFGDGTTDNSQNPSHTYANFGTYTVWLIATTASGVDSSSATVTLTPNVPIASFSYTFKTPNIIEFSDNSSNSPTQWLWDFGNGTSTLQNPTDTFTVGGHYNVCLIATNSEGSSAAFCQTVIIVLGIDSPDENTVGDFYPNPVQIKSFIEIEGVDNGQLGLKVFDMQGRE
ncbi:MAG: immune inhibitor A, partial [Bacteroidales bacterium]|nr:immune inhibitor A [Bacteroidales bacterium]